MRKINQNEHDLTTLLPLQRVPYRNIVVMMITMILTDQNKMATNENDQPMKIMAPISYRYRDQTFFLCINVCWTPRVMLKPEPAGEGFNDA